MILELSSGYFFTDQIFFIGIFFYNQLLIIQYFAFIV